jgi:hypothetical protein
MARPRDQDKAWAQLRADVDKMKRGQTQTATLGGRMPSPTTRSGLAQGLRSYGIDIGKRRHGPAPRAR